MGAQASEPFHSSLLGKAVIVTTYLGLNMSLNIFNKWVLTLYGFRFPLFLSISHMVFGLCALAPVVCLRSFRDLHIPTLQKQWLGLLGVGCFFAVNVGFNNVSLLSMSLSLNQVIRSVMLSGVVPLVAGIALFKGIAYRHSLL